MSTYANDGPEVVLKHLSPTDGTQVHPPTTIAMAKDAGWAKIIATALNQKTMGHALQKASTC